MNIFKRTKPAKPQTDPTLALIAATNLMLQTSKR